MPSAEGWLSLAAVLDLGGRRIVGWAMEATMQTTLTRDALRMALTRRRGVHSMGTQGEPLIHHSDRGVPSACDECHHLLARQGMRVSMSGKGNCYDHAAMESFWATLKTELVHHEQDATHEEAQGSIFEYIEVFYNRVRLPSTLGYQSPEAFEASLT